MSELERIKREWLCCAKLIRAKYSFKYPRYFDDTIENEIESYLKSIPLIKRFEVVGRGGKKV